MNAKQSSLDWRIWWQLFTRRWYIIAITTFLGISFGLYKSFTTEPEYESTSTIMFLDTDLLSGSALRFVPGAPQREEIDYFRRRITSVDFLKTLLTKIDIHKEPKVVARINQLLAESPTVPRHEIEEIVCIEYLQEQLSTRNKTYNIIELNAKGETAEKAYNLAQLFTSLAISESQKNEVELASLASRLGNELLDTYKKQLDEAEDRLERYKKGMMQETPNDLKLDEEKLNAIESLLYGLKVDIDLKNENIDELNNELQGISRGYKGQLENEINDVKDKMLQRTESVCRLFKKFDWRDVEISILNEEIARLKKEIIEKIRAVISAYYINLPAPTIDKLVKLETYNVEVAHLERQQATFTNIINEHNEFVKNTPTREAYIARLESEVSKNKEIYDLMLQQVRGNQIREAAQQQEAQLRFRLLMPPQRPLERVRPHRRKIMMISFFVGLLLGVGTVVGLENLNTTIKDVDDVTDYLKVPVLATIPKLDSVHSLLMKRRAKRILAFVVPVVIFSAALVAYTMFMK